VNLEDGPVKSFQWTSKVHHLTSKRHLHVVQNQTKAQTPAFKNGNDNSPAPHASETQQPLELPAFHLLSPNASSAITINMNNEPDVFSGYCFENGQYVEAETRHPVNFSVGKDNFDTGWNNEQLDTGSWDSDQDIVPEEMTVNEMVADEIGDGDAMDVDEPSEGPNLEDFAFQDALSPAEGGSDEWYPYELKTVSHLHAF
jgi:hypothetical protein